MIHDFGVYHRVSRQTRHSCIARKHFRHRIVGKMPNFGEGRFAPWGVGVLPQMSGKILIFNFTC